MRKAYFLFIFILAITIIACHKEGSGGKASLSGTLKHHADPIPFCEVYIKYGATEFPGVDVSKYDAHVTSDANAFYEIKDLYKGDYYLYGVGYDATLMGIVSGGVGIKIKKNQNYTVNVPVTE